MGQSDNLKPWRPTDRASASKLNAMLADIRALSRSPMRRGIVDATGRYPADSGAAATFSGGDQIILRHVIYTNQSLVMPSFTGGVVIIEAIGAGGNGGASSGSMYGGGGAGGTSLRAWCYAESLSARTLSITIGQGGTSNQTTIVDSVSPTLLSIGAINGSSASSNIAAQPSAPSISAVSGNAVISWQAMYGMPGQHGTDFYWGFGGHPALGLNRIPALSTPYGGMGGRGAAIGGSPETGTDGLVLIYY